MLRDTLDLPHLQSILDFLKPTESDDPEVIELKRAQEEAKKAEDELKKAQEEAEKAQRAKSAAAKKAVEIQLALDAKKEAKKREAYQQLKKTEEDLNKTISTHTAELKAKEGKLEKKVTERIAAETELGDMDRQIKEYEEKIIALQREKIKQTQKIQFFKSEEKANQDEIATKKNTLDHLESQKTKIQEALKLVMPATHEPPKVAIEPSSPIPIEEDPLSPHPVPSEGPEELKHPPTVLSNDTDPSLTSASPITASASGTATPVEPAQSSAAPVATSLSGSADPDRESAHGQESHPAGVLTPAASDPTKVTSTSAPTVEFFTTVSSGSFTHSGAAPLTSIPSSSGKQTQPRKTRNSAHYKEMVTKQVPIVIQNLNEVIVNIQVNKIPISLELSKKVELNLIDILFYSPENMVPFLTTFFQIGFAFTHEPKHLIHHLMHQMIITQPSRGDKLEGFKKLFPTFEFLVTYQKQFNIDFGKIEFPHVRTRSVSKDIPDLTNCEKVITYATSLSKYRTKQNQERLNKCRSLLGLPLLTPPASATEKLGQLPSVAAESTSAAADQGGGGRGDPSFVAGSSHATEKKPTAVEAFRFIALPPVGAGHSSATSSLIAVSSPTVTGSTVAAPTPAPSIADLTVPSPATCGSGLAVPTPAPVGDDPAVASLGVSSVVAGATRVSLPTTTSPLSASTHTASTPTSTHTASTPAGVPISASSRTSSLNAEDEKASVVLCSLSFLAKDRDSKASSSSDKAPKASKRVEHPSNTEDEELKPTSREALTHPKRRK